MSSHTIEPGRLSLDQFISSASDAELVLLDMPGPGDLSSLRADVCWGPKSVPKSLEACRLLPLAPQNIVAPQVLRPLTFHDVFALICNAPISEQEATLAPLRGQLLHAEVLLEQAHAQVVEQKGCIAIQVVQLRSYTCLGNTPKLSLHLYLLEHQDAIITLHKALYKVKVEMKEAEGILDRLADKLSTYGPGEDMSPRIECQKTIVDLCEQGLKVQVELKVAEGLLEQANMSINALWRMFWVAE